MRGRALLSQNVKGFGFTVPILVLFVLFGLLPTIYAFVISFTEFDLFSPPTFVGLDNYFRLVNNPNF